MKNESEKQMKRYYLFYEHRGYAEMEIFKKKTDAVGAYNKLDINYDDPILVYGECVSPKKKGTPR